MQSVALFHQSLFAFSISQWLKGNIVSNDDPINFFNIINIHFKFIKLNNKNNNNNL